MEYLEVLAALTTEERISIGVIEKFLQELPEKAWHLGTRVLLSVIVFMVGVQLIKVIRKIVKKSLVRGHADKGVIQFIDSFLKAALYAVLIITIASGFGLDAASILALLGSAGVAIGLAIQGSLSNFVGGVLILLIKPFKVGDYIKEDTNGNEGSVKEIELFYTKLITPDNKIIVLPNGTLANSSLTNVTACDKRRMDITVRIPYTADIKLAKEVLEQVLKNEEAVLKDQEHFAYANELGDAFVSIGVRCWFTMEDFWQGKWRVTENIKYALDEAGVSIFAPQMEITLKEKCE
ncbi:mechanosensitive ion channel family protein [Kineothrix sp. MB12-C1]|uniref:mechanosensitive ion channel family protein n=1 Tax=Kineothrix sp. MB12-C1 TaxID=3070215 RepID=UPI0027D2FD6F|nr:mechanosensitive ion channel family protein [Kineothrix sp. MB12-C1]WMC92505.1 mechanosensitive ion channel family protein [Kineothrix sp. MB12-C1]